MNYPFSILNEQSMQLTQNNAMAIFIFFAMFIPQNDYGSARKDDRSALQQSNISIIQYNQDAGYATMQFHDTILVEQGSLNG